MSLLDAAVVEFISHIIKNRGFNASRLCVKDPDLISVINTIHFNKLYNLSNTLFSAFKYMEYLHFIFPKSKFIYMVRDGRAVAYSLMVQLKERMLPQVFRAYMATWTTFNRVANRVCISIGSRYCLRVRYEDLVLHPEKTIRNVMLFLGEDWTNDLLKHQEHVGGKISISKTEWSSHQIVSINLPKT